MASVQLLASLFVLVAVVDWATITSGEQSVSISTDIDEKQSVDTRPSPVKLLHHGNRANIHHSHRRLIRRSTSGRLGNDHHGNDLRRGPTHPLAVNHPISVQSSDKPLVRKKRIRRDGKTPTVSQTPSLQRALAPGHGLVRDKSKPKVGHAGKIHRRRKSAGRKARGHSLPNNMISLDEQSLSYGKHARDRRTHKPFNSKTSMAKHPQRPLVSRGHRLYHTRGAGKTPVSQPDNRHLPESMLDRFHAHPAAAVRSRVGALTRRRVSASGSSISGSGERRRPPGGRPHHRGVGYEVSQPLNPGIVTSHRRALATSIRASDGNKKKSSSGGRTETARATRKLTRGPRQSPHHQMVNSQQQQLGRSKSSTRQRSSRSHLARMKHRRTRTVHG